MRKYKLGQIIFEGDEIDLPVGYDRKFDPGPEMYVRIDLTERSLAEMRVRLEDYRAMKALGLIADDDSVIGTVQSVNEDGSVSILIEGVRSGDDT